MNVRDLIEKTGFEVINEGDLDREAVAVYCCDLLSWVMGRAPADSAWLTVMGNMNTIAVAVLADVSVIILAEGAAIDDAAKQRAGQQGVNILRTTKPAFEAGLMVDGMLSSTT